MEGNTHQSVDAPPSVFDRPEDPDEDDRERGTNAMTTEDAFGTDDPGDLFEQGECPWCDEYGGDHPRRHAVKAHPDEWDEFNED